VNLRGKTVWLCTGLLAGILLAAGCGGGGGASSGNAGSPPGPTAALTMYGSGANFGDVAVGSSTTLGVTLTNSGTAPLTLLQNSVSGAGFTISGIGQGVTLNPGQYVTLAVTFAPSTSGVSNGTVSLTSTTSGLPISLPLSGNGVVAAHSATVTWNPSHSVVVGYNVYRTLASNEAWSKLNASPVIATSYSDWDVQPGQSYLYVVTSVNPKNGESPFSEATFSAIPAP